MSLCVEITSREGWYCGTRKARKCPRRQRKDSSSRKEAKEFIHLLVYSSFGLVAFPNFQYSSCCCCCFRVEHHTVHQTIAPRQWHPWRQQNNKVPTRYKWQGMLRLDCATRHAIALPLSHPLGGASNGPRRADTSKCLLVQRAIRPKGRRRL